MLKYASDAVMLIVMALLWAPSVAAIGALTLWPDPSPPLAGVISRDDPPVLNFENVVSGDVQRAWAKTFPDYMPYYDWISRRFNSVQYSMLRLSSNKSIVVGRGDYLHNPAQIATYCTRSLARSADAIDRWVSQTVAIQSIVENRGQKFIYLLTPSKAEEVSETIPLGFPCNSPDRDIFIDSALHRLAAAGVHYVDGRKHIGEIREKFGYEPFPKGGIHWTQLTALLTASDVAEEANRLFGRTVIAPIEYTVEAAEELAPVDFDYANLLNLTVPPPANPTARVVYGPPSADPCPPPLVITAIGGSFFNAIGRALAHEKCAPIVQNLAYLVIAQVRFSPGDFSESAAPSIDYGVIDDADLVILEENASLLSKARHSPALLKLLQTGYVGTVKVY